MILFDARASCCAAAQRVGVETVPPAAELRRGARPFFRRIRPGRIWAVTFLGRALLRIRPFFRKRLGCEFSRLR